ncbi:histone-lysine N-methyltransferase EHMT1 [Plodia interpunctella]|uniref:histone-lysine N-methyltransferase EHMT1 n=1 Tax=Plodia interpunctella TaxID=58824 RepID=UPI002367962A|nr:histone-lysine N-methyltransferase EHMT1 [Plodia interpunctella]
MLDDEIDVPTASKKKFDKSQSVDNVTVTVDGKRGDKNDVEDPKPRIVLTFRSEKSGSKNSNMKIVSSEEKHEEFSPRRSSRTRSKWECSDEAESSISPNKKEKSVSENEEVSDSSAPKRSSRRRSKDSSENVLANAIARKEKSYNETVPTQRLSRRIKPTAKVLENEELRIGVESQNNVRLGIQPEKEEGVRTRRSARPGVEQSLKGSNVTVKVGDISEQNDSEKLRHLCELGLKVKDEVKEAMEEDAEGENRDSEENECEIIEEDEEIDDDSEVISKLLEADDETVSDGEGEDDDDFSYSEETSQSDKGPRTRRSTRLNSSYGNNESDESTIPDGDKTPPRRSSRRSTRHYYDEEINQDPEYVPRRKKTRMRGEEAQPEPVQEDNSNPAGGDEGSEAACPEDDSAIIATCFCTTPSNVYAAPDDLKEPVFCQAIETVDGARVGCSHLARRQQQQQLAAMLRAGPRAPYLLLCALHTEQLARHMCCVACGLFCTQGIFYQCSEKHLFHLECGLPYNDVKSSPGCPHCGVRSYRWSPANTKCNRVRVEMKCSNKRTLLAEPRQQSTPAYLTFSTVPESQKLEPVIPEDLIPAMPADVDLFKVKVEGNEQLTDDELLQILKQAIVDDEPIEKLAPKIASVRDIDGAVDARGRTCAHVAARCRNLRALYALHCAGAALDACDHSAMTPLLIAVQDLLDIDGPSNYTKHLNEFIEDMDVDQTDKEDTGEEIKEEEYSQETETSKEELSINDETATNEENIDTDDIIKEEPIDIKEEIIRVTETKDKPVPEEKEKDNVEEEEKLFKIIQFLVASGRCDINFPGPEGMTALHYCAARGGARAATLARLLSARAGAGAGAESRDRGGWTPLVWAAELGDQTMLRLLLENGADATARDKEGNGVIHWCVLRARSSCVLRLLDAAPGVLDHGNQHGDTPLHIAARHGHYSCVVILLARGARTDVPNTAGELPLDVCGEHENCRNAISFHIQMAKISSKAGKYRLLCTDIARGREQWPLPCVNALDDAPAPDHFTYVTAHVMPENIAIDNTISTLQGCSCVGGCSSGCSCVVLGVRRWYCGERLHPAFSYHEPPMLFECNSTCSCNENECGNNLVSRLMSRGSLNVRACVVRTRRGWALAARARVRCGALVALYCGELLRLDAADARLDDQYMFALDVKPDLLEQCASKTMLCVDAAKYGSAARFINHSCRANLVPVRVFTSTRDLRLPTIALFACRDIKPDEEFTFDYGDKFWSVKAKWMRCECGTLECRYPEQIKEEEES